MQAKKEFLKFVDEDGQEYIAYPKTLIECITNENGDNLEDTLKAFILDNINTAEDVGAVASNDGKFIGTLSFDRGYENGHGELTKYHNATADLGTELRDYDASGNVAKLSVNASKGEFKYCINDSSYAIFGEHNKPKVTYTGNGSSTARKISIGGVGRVLFITSAFNTWAIVGYQGALVRNGTTITSLNRAEAYFDNTTDNSLHLATTNAVLNGNGQGVSCYLL